MSDESFAEPKVIINGLRATSLSAAAPGAAKPDVEIPQRCLNTIWTPFTENTAPELRPVEVDETQQAVNELRAAVRDAVNALELREPAALTNELQSLVQWARTMQPATESITNEKLGRMVARFADASSPEDVIDEDTRLTLSELGRAAQSHSLTAIAEWMSLAALDNPHRDVLLIGDGAASLSIDLAIRTSDQFRSCVLTAPTHEDVALSKKVLEDAEVPATATVRLLQLDGDKLPEDWSEKSWDVIVAPSSLVKTAAEGLKSLLRPAGRLIVGGARIDSDPMTFFNGLQSSWWLSQHSDAGLLTPDQIVTLLGASGLEGVCHSEQGNDFIASAVAPKVALAELPSSKEIVILTPSSPVRDLSKLQAFLAARLSAMGYTVDFAVPQQSELIQNKIVLSLLDLGTNFLANINEADYESFKEGLYQAGRIIWFTAGAQPTSDDVDPYQAMATGLLRSLGNENAQVLPVQIDLPRSADLDSDHTHSMIFGVLEDYILKDDPTREREFALKDGKVFVPRLVFNDPLDEELKISYAQRATKMEPIVQHNRPLHLEIGSRGSLDSLQWSDDDHFKAPLGPDDVEFQATAMALNFVDIMVAMGQIPSNDIGCEAAGIVTRVGSNVTKFRPGQEVVGITDNGFRTLTRKDQSLIHEIPEGMTASTASSLPTIYATAYSALIDTARLEKSESVLIHAAAGGLGRAALQIAQFIGAEIYVTVGTKAKRDLIMETYGIPEDHIFSSRDASFAAGIKRMTQGKGVDVVLNSLAGELLRQTWTCIADFGRFIEVGKKDIVGNSGLEMAPFLRHVTFASLNLEHMEKMNRPRYAKLLDNTFELIRKKHVGPVHPTTEYSFNDLEKACRVMQTGKHMGKIVLKLDETCIGAVVPPPPAVPQLDPTATYILCGGLGGIGRSITQMLFSYGAEHVVFVSRSGASKPEAQEFLQKMRNQGKKVDAFACDTKDAAAVKAFVEDGKARGWKIKGFMQCAMALRNRALNNMSFEDWTVTVDSKVPNTQNFHDFLPRDLDFFIMLSSTSGILGGPGQGNYAAANTFKDAFAYWRRSQGLPAIALDLGVVNDVGHIAESGGVQNFDNFTGFEELHISEKDIAMIVQAALLGRTADGAAFPIQPVIGVGTSLLENSVLGQPFVNNPRFCHIKADRRKIAKSSGVDELREAIAASASVREAANAIQVALVSRVAKAIMVEEDDIDLSRPLHSFGVDSLVAVEMRNWIFRDLRSDVALFDLLSPMPLSVLSLKIASRSTLVSSDAQKIDLEQINKEIELASVAGS